MSVEAVAEAFERLTGVVVATAGRARFTRVVTARWAERGHLDPGRYAQTLDEREAELLAERFLPRTTSFFRDDRGLRALMATLSAHDVRGPAIWCAGCASGEEAYSLVWRAFEAGLAGVEVLATDVSSGALAQASGARYRSASVETSSMVQRSADGWWAIAPDVRRRVRFEQHALARAGAPPKGLFDAVVCRNVLLYCSSSARARALETMHAALRPRGLLLLGSAERADASVSFELLTHSDASLYRARDIRR